MIGSAESAVDRPVRATAPPPVRHGRDRQALRLLTGRKTTYTSDQASRTEGRMPL